MITWLLFVVAVGAVVVGAKCCLSLVLLLVLLLLVLLLFVVHLGAVVVVTWLLSGIHQVVEVVAVVFLWIWLMHLL